MNRKWILAAILTLGLLAVTAAVALSWSDVDPATGAGPDFMISLPLDDQAAPSVAYNSDDDEYLVVWWDERPGTDDADIYGQIFSASGIPQGDNFVVSNAADEQGYPHVAYNSTDHNYMVVWRDKRGGTNYDVYGQVVNTDGTLSGTDFAINTDAGDQKPKDIVYDPNANHYLLVWVDDGENRIEGQLLDNVGGLIGTNAFPIAAGGDRPRVAYNSNRNSYMVVYEQGGDIYGQAIAGDGSLSGSTFVVCDDSSEQATLDLEFNSNTHEYLVVWRDERNGNWDIYGRRIDEDGNLQGDEIVICDDAAGQYGPEVAYNERVNQWLVAWVDHRNLDTSGTDIYGQRVRGSDGSLAGQGNFAICDGPDDQRSVDLAARPTQTGAEYLAVWEDQRSGDGLEIVGQRVGALLGTLNWHDFNISAPLGSQEHPRVAYNSTDRQFLVVWQDERDGNSDIYAQIVLTTGIPITDNIVVRDEAHELVDPVVAYNPYANTYLIAWEDETEGDIEGVILEHDGDLAGSAFDISAGDDARQNPAVVFNPDVSWYLVVFEYQTEDGKDIYGRHVEADGDLPGDDFPISTANGDQLFPDVVYNDYDDAYLVAWSDTRDDEGDVYARRVLVNETVLDEFAISTANDAQTCPALAWNEDDNEYLVVWHDYRDSGTTGADIYGQRLSNTGGLEGDNFALSTAEGDQQYPRITYISTYGRYSIIWQDSRNTDTGWDIYNQNVNGDGSLYLGNLPRFTFSGYQQRPDGAFSPEADRGLTVWQDGRNGATFKIYGRIKEPRFPVYLPLVLRNY